MKPEANLNLLDLSATELQRLVVEWSEPRFRAAQIWRWIYHTLTDDPGEMVNLPKDLRRRLEEETHIGRLEVVGEAMSEDGLTEKVLFQADDGQLFESVLMRYTNRNSVCVSSQVGCPIGCVFCATGNQGFTRNLTTGEITAQVLHFARKLAEENAHVTNVVLMGMGEPLLNFDNMWQAIMNLNDREGLALGARRFTVSTSGIVPGIERMAHESFAVGLAISLHAVDNALRDKLVPINRTYPLDQVMDATRFYIERTGRRVTFEIALAKDVNDSIDHAQAVAELLRGMLCHVNLIPLNPVPGSPYLPTPKEQVMRFQEILVQARIQTTIRLARGTAIQAGCGQLRGQYLLK